MCSSDLLLYTGRRVDGSEAAALGLVDRCVGPDVLVTASHELAASIAESAPLAVESIRATLRAGLADRVAAAVEHERREQERLRSTRDFAEGVRATSERRSPSFERR